MTDIEVGSSLIEETPQLQRGPHQVLQELSNEPHKRVSMEHLESVYEVAGDSHGEEGRLVGTAQGIYGGHSYR